MLEEYYKCSHTASLHFLRMDERSIRESNPVPYHDLKSITNIMLTRALRSLEEHGLVVRREVNQIPPHVEYSLTPKCREVLPALKIIHEWGSDLLTVFNAKSAQKTG